MYNKFAENITKESDPVRQKALYNEKTLIGRLHQYFTCKQISQTVKNP